MSWLSSFLHPERGYQGAQQQLDKYYNQGQGYQQPYNEMGVAQGQTLTDAIQKLMNPGGLRDEWEKNYTTSDAARNTMDMAKNQGIDAASSLGLTGSTPALQALQAGTAGIAAEDKQNYLKQLMDLYKTGLDTSSGMYNTGANTAGQMGQNAANMGSSSSGAKFGETNAPGAMFGQVGGSVLKTLMDYLTGGMGKGGFGRGAFS